MQYRLEIDKDDFFESIRPSIEGLNGKIVERDTMDEVIHYIVSTLSAEEHKQLAEIYWSYVDDFTKTLLEAEGINVWQNIRYGILEFVINEKSRWKMLIVEHDKQFRDNYKEPEIPYMDIDE